MPRSMTSPEVKKLLIGRFNFFNGYVGAVTEAANLNAADVIAVKHGGKVQEYEIKLSRSDLVGELRCARVAKGLDKLDSYTKKQVQLAMAETTEMTDDQRAVLLKHGHTLSKTKLKKHRLYLTGEGREGRSIYGFPPPRPFVPHTFYWCIPHELLEICRQLNEGLPYGIYVFDLPQTGPYYSKFIVKPARSLGGQGDRLYFELFNRACTEWADARNEVAWLTKRLSEAEPDPPTPTPDAPAATA